MRYIYYMVLLLPILFIGEVVGLMVHCENSKYLYPAKNYVWLVPILQIIILFDFLGDSIKDKDFKLLIGFFKYGQSSLIILGSICNELDHKKSTHIRKRNPSKTIYPSLRRTAQAAMVAIETIA